MKTNLMILFALLTVILIGTLSSFNSVKNEAPNQTTGSYIVIQNNSPTVMIHYGGNKVDKIELTKEQLNATSSTNYVIDLMTKFDSEGYALVCTHSILFPRGEQVTYFLKRSK